MRISDWSSDVCSSGLVERTAGSVEGSMLPAVSVFGSRNVAILRSSVEFSAVSPVPRPYNEQSETQRIAYPLSFPGRRRLARPRDGGSVGRKSVVSGTSVAVRLCRGGGRTLKQKN